jgi:hypothetical protein
MGVAMQKFGFGAQVGFRWDRGTIDGLFTAFVGLSKRKEHGLETWALFIDLVKAFDTVPREALFAVLWLFGLPDHFAKVVMRLHFVANIKVKICEEDSEVELELELIQNHMTQKPMLRVEVGAVSCSRFACVAHKVHARENRGAWASAACKAIGCVYLCLRL